MSGLRWVKNLFTKKESKTSKSGSKDRSFDSKQKRRKNPDELVVQNVTAQFFFLQGVGPGKYDCLDTYGLYDKHSQVFSFYAVFDGHGSSGKEASNSACDFMLAYIDKHHEKVIRAESDDVIEELLLDMFVKADEALKATGVDTDSSGTTCVCVLAKGTALYVANAGDSRAVLGRIAPQYKFAVELTQDHRPYVKKERERIIKSGGSIKKIVNGAEQIGPFRIWADEDGPGLGFTRCLGNFSSKRIGMICTPQVQRINLKETDRFVVIASDGLWEVMSSTDVVAFILRLGEDRSQAAKQLVVEARNIWYELNRVKKTEAKISDSPEIRFGIDDISAIIIFFSYQGVEFHYSHRGQTQLSFNNADRPKTFTITVEGASDRLKDGDLPKLYEDDEAPVRDALVEVSPVDENDRDLATTKWEDKKDLQTGRRVNRDDDFGPLMPDQGQPVIPEKGEVDFNDIFHSADQQEERQKLQFPLDTYTERGKEYLDSDILRAEKEQDDRLIKNEYDAEFDIDLEDDFIPEDIKKFQENHNIGGFRGLTRAPQSQRGGSTSQRKPPLSKEMNPKPRNIDIDSMDLLGDL